MEALFIAGGIFAGGRIGGGQKGVESRGRLAKGIVDGNFAGTTSLICVPAKCRRDARAGGQRQVHKVKVPATNVRTEAEEKDLRVLIQETVTQPMRTADDCAALR